MTTRKEELKAMRLPELQAKYAEVVGEETRAPNRKFLIRKITEAMGVGEASGTGQEVAEAAGEGETGPQENAPTEDPGRAIKESPVNAEASEPEVTSESGPEPALETKPAGDAPEGGTKLSKMTPTELRARYRELVGRESRSSNRRYLIWRVQQAQKGRVPVGPLAGRGGEKVDVKVLPMRVPTAAIGPLDEVWKKLGIRSRNAMFRAAVAAFLINAGESTLAEHFGAVFTPDDDEGDAE